MNLLSQLGIFIAYDDISCSISIGFSYYALFAPSFSNVTMLMDWRIVMFLLFKGIQV